MSSSEGVSVACRGCVDTGRPCSSWQHSWPQPGSLGKPHGSAGAWGQGGEPAPPAGRGQPQHVALWSFAALASARACTSVPRAGASTAWGAGSPVLLGSRARSLSRETPPGGFWGSCWGAVCVLADGKQLPRQQTGETAALLPVCFGTSKAHGHRDIQEAAPPAGLELKRGWMDTDARRGGKRTRHWGWGEAGMGVRQGTQCQGG